MRDSKGNLLAAEDASTRHGLVYITQRHVLGVLFEAPFDVGRVRNDQDADQRAVEDVAIVEIFLHCSSSELCINKSKMFSSSFVSIALFLFLNSA